MSIYIVYIPSAVSTEAQRRNLSLILYTVSPTADTVRVSDPYVLKERLRGPSP